MRGVRLPGGRRVEIDEVAIPEPGPGELLLRMRASAICGSDIRAIYREHTGTDAEAYRGVVAGHEPAGEVVGTGPRCRRFAPGDRVLVYHIAGCGLCHDCRLGYMISCSSPLRAAYGWQRDGGHADFLVADERTCIALPEQLSYADGACISCTFGTAYEAVMRAHVSGASSVLITGVGPVGMAVGLLSRALGAGPVIGVDTVATRLELARSVGAIDHVLAAALADEGIAGLTGGHGCEVSVDCSGSAEGRRTAVRGTRRRGHCVLVGEGGRLDVEASPELIHPSLTMMGSWVTSVGRMEELVERLVRWDLHPELMITHRLPLDRAAEAYAMADSGQAGKVCLIMDG